MTLPGTLTPSSILTVRLEQLPDSPPLKDHSRIRFHHYSTELLGSVRILDEHLTEVAAGGSVYAQIRLESPVPAVAGDRFIIRRYSPARTIGGGLVLDPHIGKLSRRTRRDILQSLDDISPRARLPLLARLAGAHGVSIHQLQLHLGVPAAILLRQLETWSMKELVRIGSGLNTEWLHRDAIAHMRKSAMTFLKNYFSENRLAVGVAKGEFTQQLFSGFVPPTIAEYVIDDLRNEKIVVIDGDRVDVPGRSSDLSGAEGELARLIEKQFAQAGLQTPAVSEIIRAIPQKPKVIEGVISFLVKKGTLFRLAEGVYLHQQTLSEAAAKLGEHQGRMADVGWFKELYGISRKVAIPLLEYFDRQGLTKRVGDQRQVL